MKLATVSEGSRGMLEAFDEDVVNEPRTVRWSRRR
jgi:hypothetical protein